MSFTQQEMDEFIVDARELLDVAEKSLLALDQGEEFAPAFDSVFRCFHNLKGAAAMMDLPHLQDLTHELESILMKFKSAPPIPKEYLNLFLRGVDAARSMFDGRKVDFNFHIEQPEVKSEPSVPAQVINEFIAESEEVIERISRNLHLLESASYTRESVDELYRDVHSLKGAAYLFSFTSLGDITHAMESSLEAVRSGAKLASPALLNALFKGVKLIEALVQHMKSKTPADEVIPMIAKLIQELTLTSEKLETAPAAEAPAGNEPAAILKERDSEVASSIRVPVSLLDNLMTLMGEMVLVRNQVLQYSNNSEDLEFLSISKRLNVVTSEIQGDMMKTRMQPIGNVLSKFNRLVRDLSQELNKSLSLTISGAETELDKSLLESIKDPLTHIVRNSCDHGIENAEVRRNAGKPATGKIDIKAYHEGGQVVLEVADDGKGLHKEVLLKKAIERGLVTQAQAVKMNEKEIYNLIFAPGFSTAAKVTNVSGRGVGMDVVRTNIERMGGTVDLSSTAGAGTLIKIKIPLTLAIVPALTVKCGSGTFAIPQVKLEELVRVDQLTSENKVEVLHGAPVYRLRGNILPLVDLNKVLGIKDEREINYKNSIFNIAVVNAERCSFGLIIDEVQDTADIVVKPLTRLLKSLQVYSGATVLGDGSITLILDVSGLSKVAQIGAENTAEKESLLMDDSRKRLELQEFLLVKVNTPTKHALVLSYVNRLEEFKRKDVEYSGKQQVIRYRDVILPLICANEHLAYGPSPEKDTLQVVVISRGGALFGIIVDEILDTLSTSVETETALNEHTGIFGNLNTKEELIVVVDPFELISKAIPQSRQSLRAVHSPVSGNLPAKTILLVEDTVFFRKAIREILESAGNVVVTANNGQEALEIINKAEYSFDLIVSDIEMPKLNGFQLATAVRQHAQSAKIPMLAISSKADRQSLHEAKIAGFNVYLEKLNANELLGAVGDLLGNRINAA